MSDIAKLGFSVDTTDLKKGEKALNDFAKTGETTEKRTHKSSEKIKDDFEGIEKAVGKTAAAQVKADKAMAQFSRRSGQAGIQFQQFIGQVQGGQGIMLALSQQSADLGFVLGAPLLGAVAGITASIVGLLLPSLFSTNEEIQNITKNINGFIGSLNDLTAEQREAATQGLQSQLIGQTKRFAELTEEVRELEREFSNSKFLQKQGGILEFFSDPEETLQELAASKLALQSLGVEIEETTSKIKTLSDANSDNPAVDKMIEALKTQADTYGANERAVSLYKAQVEGANIAQLNEIASTFDLIDAKKEEVEARRKSTAFDKSVDDLAASIERQVIAMRDGASASLEFTAAKRLGLSEDEELPKVIQDQINALRKLKKEKEEALKLKNSKKEFEKLTKDVENFGGTWSKTGSIIVDAFGDMSNSLTDYMDRLEEIGKLEKRVAEARVTFGEDNAEVIMLQKELDEEKVSAELAGMKSIASATASLFAEKTAAAKAFAALNKIITVAEIALSFQKMAAGTAEATTHVANETTKQGANALTAITSAFAAPFPINFVAGSAMIGIMASLLGSVFGGSGGGNLDPTQATQESQGTGTVFGSDDKSQSILESQERFEDLQIDQLSELRGIRDSINSLSNGISNLARSLVGTVGTFDFEGSLEGSDFTSSGVGKLLNSTLGALDPTGLISGLLSGFSKTTKKVVDQGIQFVSQTLGNIIESGIVQADAFFAIEVKKSKFFGLSKSKKLKIETQDIDNAIQEQMAAIFGFIGDTVLQSAEILGFETVTIMKQGFGSQGFLDEMDIAEMRQFIGGRFGQFFGAVFTETEVSLEEALSQFQINIGRVSFEGLSGEEIEQELQAIFSQQADLIAKFLVPSIAEYQQVGEGLFDTLTRVTKEQVVFNDNIAKMGFDLSELSNVIQIDVAQSIIQLTGGLENFSDLTTSFFENFFSDAEQFAFLEQSLTEAFDSLGLSVVTSREEFKALVEGIDITTEEGQALLAALLEINPALSDYIDELERVESKRVDMNIELLRLQGDAEQALAMERELELEAMDESLRALQLLIFAEEDRIALLKEQQAAVRDSFAMLEKAVDLEKQRAQAILDVAAVAHESELNRINELRIELEAENALRQEAFLNSKNALIKSFDAANKAIELEKQRAKAVLDTARISLNSELERISVLRKSLDEEKKLREQSIKSSEDALKKSFNFVEQSIQLEKERASAILDAAKLVRDAEVDRVESIRQSLEDEKSLREQILLDSEDSLNKAFSSEIDLIRNNASERINLSEQLASEEIRIIEENSKVRIEGLQQEKSALEDTASSMKSLVDSINSSIGLSGSTDLVSALDAARLGDFTKAQSLDIGALTNLGSSGFSSAEELAVQEAVNRNRLKSISDLAVTKLTETELMIAAIDSQSQFIEISSNNQIAAINKRSEDEILAIQEQSEAEVLALENQLKELLGIDDSVLSISDAINAFNEAQNSLDSLNYEEEQQRLDQLIVDAEDEFALHEQGYADEIERLDAVIMANQDQLNALLGIDTSVLSIPEAISLLGDAQQSLDELGYEEEQQRLDQLIVDAEDEFALHEQGYADEIERLDAVIMANQDQLNALLGIDTSVLSVDEAIKQFQEAQQAIDELGYAQEVERLDMLVDSANEVFELHKQAYEDELERLDAILTDNEELLNAALGIDASVLSVADAIAALNASISALSSSGGSGGSETTDPVTTPFAPVDDQGIIPIAPPKGIIFIDDPKPNPETAELKEEIIKTREDNALFQREVIKNTKKTARLLQRFELNGLDTNPQ